MTETRLYFTKNDGYPTMLYDLMTLIFVNIYNFENIK